MTFEKSNKKKELKTTESIDLQIFSSSKMKIAQANIYGNDFGIAVSYFLFLFYEKQLDDLPPKKTQLTIFFLFQLPLCPIRHKSKSN